MAVVVGALDAIIGQITEVKVEVQYMAQVAEAGVEQVTVQMNP